MYKHIYYILDHIFVLFCQCLSDFHIEALVGQKQIPGYGDFPGYSNYPGYGKYPRYGS